MSKIKSKLMTYTSPNGIVYPLEEAEYDMSLVVYKSDRKKAIIGDPLGCLIALGANRINDVVEAYIGSGGDAYLIFKARDKKPAMARHFTIPAQAAKVRDTFDTKGAPETQIIMLRAPTAARTLAARAAMNKDRDARIKNGTHVVTPRSTPAKKRIMKLGIAQRPTARISRAGVDVQPISA